MMYLLGSHLALIRCDMIVGFTTLLAMEQHTSRTLMPWPCPPQSGSNSFQVVA